MYEEMKHNILPWAMLGMLTEVDAVPVEKVVDKPNPKIILAGAEAKRQRKNKKRMEQSK